MSIELDDIVLAVDGNQEALERVQQFQDDPSNISIVLEQIFSSTSLSNPKLFFGLSIILKKQVEVLLKSEEELDTLSFATPILEFLGTLPPNTSLQPTDLFEIIREFIKFDSGPFMEFLFQQFVELFNSESSIHMTKLGLTVSFEMFTKCKTEEERSNVMQLVSPFLAARLEICKSKFDPIIVKEIAQIYMKFIKLARELLSTEESHSICSGLLEFFSIEADNTEDVVKMRIELTEMFRNATSVFTTGPQINEDYATFFVSEIVPHLPQIVIAQLQYFVANRNQLNDVALAGLIYFATKLAQLGTEDFVSSDFIAEVIIPAAVLTNEQIAEMFQNPIIYLTFDLVNEPENVPFVRAALYMYIYTLFKQFNIDDLLPGDDCTDAYEFEARIFLYMCRFFPRGSEKVICIPKAVGKTLIEAIGGLDLDTICGLDVEEIAVNIESTVLTDREELGQFCLLPTLLKALRKSLVASAEMRDVAYQIFESTNPSNIVLRTVSLDLLYTAISLCLDLGDIPITDLVEQVIAYIQNPIKTSAGSYFLQFLIEDFDAAKQFGEQLIEPLISDWRDCLAMAAEGGDEQNEMEDGILESTIETIDAIISTMSQESLHEFAQPIAETAVELFQTYESEASPFLSVVSSIVAKLDQIPDVFLDFYTCLVGIVQKTLETGGFLDFRFFADIVVSLVNKLAGFAENEEVMQNLIEMVAMIGTCSELYPNDQATSLPIISAIISKCPGTAESLMGTVNAIYEQAAGGEQGPEVHIIFAATYACVAALQVSNGELLGSVPQELTELWVAYAYDPEREEYSNCKLHPNAPISLRDLNIWTVALMYLANAGNTDALNNAFYMVDEMLKKIAKKLKRQQMKQSEKECLVAEAQGELEENEEEEPFMEEEMEEDDDELIQMEDDLFISDNIKLAIDGINSFALYLQTVKSAGIEDQLPPEFLQTVNNNIRNLDQLK